MISVCRDRLLRSEAWRAWRNLWHDYLLPLLRLFVLLPVLASLLASVLLLNNGQMREILLRLGDQLDFLSLVSGLLGLAIFSLVLFFHIKANTSGRYVALYSHVSQMRLPWALRSARLSLAYLLAALPFLAVAWVITGLPFGKDKIVPLLAVWLAMLVLSLAGLGLLDRLRFSPPVYKTYVPLVSAALIFCPLLIDREYLIYGARAAGPLALVGIELASMFVLATLAVRFARAYGRIVPYVIGLWLFAFLVTTIASYTPSLLAMLSGTQQSTQNEKQAEEAAAAETKPLDTELATAFKAWLGHDPNGDRAKGSVYIVAAEGGGIYAATAAATFLATLRSDCPPCAERVFAITGVSGGAVGAALYSAASLVENKGEPAPRVREVLQADHLSPVLSVFVPGLVLDLTEDFVDRALAPLGIELSMRLSRYVTRRDQMLERSLECPGNPFADGCDAGAGDGFRASLAEHWNGGARYGLILNTTAESGKTVAFAPFALKDLRDPDLTSFLDAPYGLKADEISAVAAASASARFPLVLPPYVSNGRNFVDGGYADNSGLASAGAIFQSLREVAPARDIRLIVLTSVTSSQDEDQNVTSKFRDLAVPLYALWNVRARIGPQKVARTINQFGGQSGMLVDVLQTGGDFFLGWTISQDTMHKISCQLGMGTCDLNAAAVLTREKNRQAYCRIVTGKSGDCKVPSSAL